MIVFDLKCEPSGHVFEAWFGSSGDYEDQRARGLIQCPLCGVSEVGKALMAPNVAPKGNKTSSSVPAPADSFYGAPEEMKAMLQAMAAVQKKILQHSEFVGDSFADEARSIHLGEAERRAIYGRATPDEANQLLDEGIEIAPLPFPVVEPTREN